MCANNQRSWAAPEVGPQIAAGIMSFPADEVYMAQKTQNVEHPARPG
jgi:hypothetical protein